MTTSEKPSRKEKDTSKVHKLSLKGSARLVAEFFQYSIHTILYQRGVYPAEDFTVVKKYGLNMLVSADDQVKAYIKKIMSQLDRWMVGGKISRLVIVITNKDTGEHLERWQFDVQIFAAAKSSKSSKSSSRPKDAQAADGSKTAAAAAAAAAEADTSSTTTTAKGGANQENADGRGPAAAAGAQPAENKTEQDIQQEIAAIFRQITASVTFLPQLDAGECTFNVLVYADADSEVPVEWGDSDAKEIEGGERVQLRGFSTNSHRIETLVSYKQKDW